MANKNLAILGFVLSLASGGLPGLIVSAIALKNMKNSGEEDGKEFAIAGLVIGIVATAATIISVLLTIIFPIVVLAMVGV